MKTNSINNILIVGGTHGNELSGVQAVNNWINNDACTLRPLVPSAKLQLALANQGAIDARVRYQDDDLNRQFSIDKLHTQLSESSAREAVLAQSFNKKYGPKLSSASDLVIDIHNTTSNMGPTLIILVNDNFHQQLARYVKQKMPESVILLEDYQDYNDFAYLCTIGKKGVMIEIGPQTQSTLRAAVYQQTVTMTEIILQFVELYNTQKIENLSPVEAYRLGTEISYPTDKNTQTGVVSKSAMIHPNLDAKDFQELRNGHACFIDFDGNDIPWDGEDTYPHFIGEAAYDHLHLAFATSSKCSF